uniref:RNA-dependent RNA polymerase n=1 Tax=Crocidura lasiura ribovirus 19 TaxID=3139497 RepID=A0AB38ZJS9_9VIRU
MCVLSRLTCGCKRGVTTRVPPTAKKASLGSVKYAIRNFLSEHTDTIPPHFHSYVQSAVPDWLQDAIIKPFHFNDVLEDVANSSSPGYYYRQLGFRTKRSVIETCPNRLRYYAHMIKTGKLRCPRPLTIVSSVSSKIVEGKRKDRVAWIYPVEVSAIEAMFERSLALWKPADYEPKPETHHGEWCGTILAWDSDFSRFDSTVPQWLVEYALDVIESRLRFDEYITGEKPYKATSLQRLWQFIRHYFVHTPFLLDGKVHTKRHGVPSGSRFTNVVDTIISSAVLSYLHATNECNARVITYGDDGHNKFCTCDPSAVVKGALQAFGMLLKVQFPNEHGCLTYCQAECHNGEPFHPGIWFANILNCAPTHCAGLVAYCLMMSARPTKQQARELRGYCLSHFPAYVHARERLWIDKLIGHGEAVDITSIDCGVSSL